MGTAEGCNLEPRRAFLIANDRKVMLILPNKHTKYYLTFDVEGLSRKYVTRTLYWMISFKIARYSASTFRCALISQYHSPLTTKS